MSKIFRGQAPGRTHIQTRRKGREGIRNGGEGEERGGEEIEERGWDGTAGEHPQIKFYYYSTAHTAPRGSIKTQLSRFRITSTMQLAL
jgi:hypothetical protein